jgi:hypothetical protein
MRRLAPTTVLILILATGSASAGDRWLHVRAQDLDGDEGNIVINLPLKTVEAMLPSIQTDVFHAGRIRIDGDGDSHDIDLRRIVEALRDAPDAEFVTVRTHDESIRVAKEQGFLLLRVDERDGDQVHVRVPMAVVETLLSESGDEMDLSGALNALADYEGGDLITIESNDGSVRVWIDASESGD